MGDSKVMAASGHVLLRVDDHRRDLLGMRYVYPVVSRRARGVSVGVNLNPNNACNWACVYCQVPDLKRGAGPELDLGLLRAELDQMLDAVVHGDFLARSAPPEAQRLNDIALSGNGEPTSSPQFGAVITLIGEALRRFGLAGQIKLVLITNGSQSYKPVVQKALRTMRDWNGEVWFKFDRAPVDDYSWVNQVALTAPQVLRHLAATAACCPTWIQSCFFAVDGAPPDEAMIQAYLDVLGQTLAQSIPLRGVMLYGLARPSLQPDAPRLSRLDEAWLNQLAERIEALGLTVQCSP
jgi:wyosine [tRNA(Phe)-imidazoG37] synthetase (radical SAM superfamily)